jgi:hypothetical protein
VKQANKQIVSPLSYISSNRAAIYYKSIIETTFIGLLLWDKFTPSPYRKNFAFLTSSQQEDHPPIGSLLAANKTGLDTQ